jgi:hypothetical protein
MRRVEKARVWVRVWKAGKLQMQNRQYGRNQESIEKAEPRFWLIYSVCLFGGRKYAETDASRNTPR